MKKYVFLFTGNNNTQSHPVLTLHKVFSEENVLLFNRTQKDSEIKAKRKSF